jgi:drug/metabolite transporter (DMT)-like permease
MSLRDLVLLVVICLVWAANNLMSKLIIAHFGAPPLFYTAVRFGVVALATLPWLFPAPRPLWRMIVVGLTLGGGSMALNFISLQTISSSTFAVLSQLNVPMATALSVVMLGERIRWERCLCMAMTLLGSMIIMWNPTGLAPTVGTLYVVAASFVAALGAVLIKQVEGVTPRQFQAWVGFSSVISLAALSAATETGQAAILMRAFWPFVAAVLISGLLVSVVAHTAFYGLVQRYEVNLLQPLTLITPLATIVMGVAITHDVFGPRMIVGSAIALAGVLMAALGPGHGLAPLALMRRRAP